MITRDNPNAQRICEMEVKSSKAFALEGFSGLTHVHFTLRNSLVGGWWGITDFRGDREPLRCSKAHFTEEATEIRGY